MNVMVLRHAWLAAASLTVLVPASCSAVVRTVNIDFGNGGVYSGDDGVLSSPGGTFWNEVTVQNPSTDYSYAYLDGLKDEYGNTIDIGGSSYWPEVNVFLADVEPIIGAGIGPLSDGVTLSTLTPTVGGIVIRELSAGTPIEMVVYFADPVGDARLSEIVISAGFWGPQTDTVRSEGGSGFFPGQTSLLPSQQIDYVRFTDLTVGPTTLGIPQWPGVILSLPILDRQSADPVAHIAAIQIRGDFVSTPEPTSSVLAMCTVAVCAIPYGRARRRDAER